MPEVQAEFNATNPMRCSVSELPFCACANKPSGPKIFPPPPPYIFSETFHGLPSYAEGEQMLGGAEGPWNADLGQASALVKRMVNARTIDLSLRQSHRSVSCPGTEDGEQSCARSCAAEHLTELRAFTVTGDWNAPPPPSSPPPYVAPESPPPPSFPFNRCANTCSRTEADDAGDTRCHDGGFSSFLPTYCAYGTDCAHCGFRDNNRYMADDDSCVSALNGVCEDGGHGSAYITDQATTKITSVCGLGTDHTDCAQFGYRMSQEIGEDAFTGLTNYTLPSPPPPQPQPPPPPPPPPVAFDGNRQTCVAWFLRSKTVPYTYSYDCSDLDGVACLSSNTDPDVQRIALCSDGGFSAHPVRWVTSALDRSAGATVFGCDYGASMNYCNPRTRDVTTNDDCDPTGVNNAGACRDSCWVDTGGTAHNTEEGYDSSATGATLGSDKQCHDGGPGSLSAKCGYGTQVR